MSATVDLTKVIELKRDLEERFNTGLHIHDTCGGQYFGVENMEPSAKNFIEQYFERLGYIVIFNPDETEFHLEEMRLC